MDNAIFDLNYAPLLYSKIFQKNYLLSAIALSRASKVTHTFNNFLAYYTYLKKLAIGKLAQQCRFSYS